MPGLSLPSFNRRPSGSASSQPFAKVPEDYVRSQLALTERTKDNPMVADFRARLVSPRGYPEYRPDGSQFSYVPPPPPTLAEDVSEPSPLASRMVGGPSQPIAPAPSNQIQPAATLQSAPDAGLASRMVGQLPTTGLQLPLYRLLNFGF